MSGFDGRGGAMKYKVINTNLYIDKKLYCEGKEADLTDEQIKGLEQFLIPIESETDPQGLPEPTEGCPVVDTVSESKIIKKSRRGKK